MSIAGDRVEQVRDVDVLMRLGRVSLLAGFALGVATAALADPPKKGPKPSAEQAQDASRFSDYLTGRAAQLDHDWAVAGPAIRRAWESAKDDQGLRHDALLLSISGGDFAGALQIARTVPADSNDAALANFVQTLEEISAGHYAPAQAKLTAEPARGLDRYLNPILIAWCEAGRGRKAEALAALNGLDQVPGIEAMRQLQTAMVYDALGDKAQATVTYDKIMDANPPLHAIILASQFYQRQGESDKARKAIERIDADGTSASLRGEMLARLSDKGRAGPAPDPKSGIADALFSISASLVAEKQNDVAPLLYTRFALYLRPDFPSAQLLLSEIGQRWGRLDDAAEVLLAINERSELRSTAERLAMGVLDKAKEDDKALKVGQAAVKAHPADMDVLLSYADLLREKNRFPEAIAAYDTALGKVSPTSNRKGLTLYHRGIAYHLSHQWAKAETDLLAALQLRPDDPGLLNYLAFSWADQGVNLDRARTMLERAIQLVPDDGAIVDSLGWCMYRAGDYSEAIKQLEHAVSLDGNDATINDHLGDAYWRAGRQIEARSQWEKAARLSDDKTLTEQIRAKLKDGLDNVENPPRRASAN
jgi:tetratricopeptide (TPR) repeat protein